MPAHYSIILPKRSSGEDDVSDDEFGGWYYSEDGRKTRYGILLAIIFLFIAFILISYQHARVRMSKGLAPLPYHSWLISSKRRRQFELAETPPPHPENNFSFYQSEHQLYVVPPPAYNPNFVQPPSYPGPPEGATKTAPQQHLPPAYPGNDAAGPSSSAQWRH